MADNMTDNVADKKSGKKRLILALIAVVILGGVALGVKTLWKRGKARESVRNQAERAYREGKYVLSADLTLEVLRSEPDSVHMRRLLLAALWQSEQFDAAETAAQRYFDEGPDHSYAANTLYQARLLHSDFAGAERIARSIADTDEESAYWMMARLRDFIGVLNMDVNRRLEAAVFARNLKPVTARESAQAEALILAATVRAEVAPLHPRTDVLMKMVARDLMDAEPLAIKAAQSERAYDKRLALGRIRILSKDESVAADGARMLRRYVSGADRNGRAVLALASYHARKAEWSEAMNLIREIRDPYLWMRVFWVLRGTKDLDAILQGLDLCPLPQEEVALLRAATLLHHGDDTRKAEGRAILENMITDQKTAVARVQRALVFLAVRVGLTEAREMAEKARLSERGDASLSSFVASLLVASEDDRERGLAMIRELAATGGKSGGEIMGALGVLGNTIAMQSFLEEQIARGGEHAFQYRLNRAIRLLAEARRKKGTPEEQELRARIKGDIEALLVGKKTTKMMHAMASNLALQIGEVELAGRCAARAMVMTGPPADTGFRLLFEVLKIPDDNDAPKRLAAGIRSELDKLPAKAYVRAMADAIEHRVRDLEKLALSMEEAAKEKASALLAYELGARAYLSMGDSENAARMARLALKQDNQNVVALETLGAVYLTRKDYEDVLTLWSGFDDLPEIGYQQTVGALVGLERNDEALKKAREMVRKLPASALAHVGLATVYLEREEDRKALSILNMAPKTVMIEYMRANLLLKLGDFTVAEQVYVRLLQESRFTAIQAWVGLQAVLTKTDRDDEFLGHTKNVLRAKNIPLADEIRGKLHYMRGAVLERRGDVPEALIEYESAIKLNKHDWPSLNNAAWHISQLKPRRMAAAKDYIERAVKAQPKNGVLRDTAAEIYSKLGDHKAALREVDIAIESGSKAKQAKYNVHKGRILLRSGDKPAAEKLLRHVIKTHTGDPAIKAAEEALWEIVGERERKKREAEAAEEAKRAAAAKKAEEEKNKDNKEGAANVKNAAAIEKSDG